MIAITNQFKPQASVLATLIQYVIDDVIEDRTEYDQNDLDASEPELSLMECNELFFALQHYGTGRSDFVWLDELIQRLQYLNGQTFNDPIKD